MFLNNKMIKTMKAKHYIMAVALLIPVTVTAQTEEESIRRTVTLYNPYKPTLQEANKSHPAFG